MVTRKIAVVTVLTVALLSAGCLSAGPDGTTPTATETPTETPPPSTTESPVASDTEAATATETAPGWEHAANQPDSSKSVTLENGWSETVTMHVRVIRNATSETVHDETYELAPRADREVYDTAAADPDGIETFTVVVSARNETRSVHIETNECYGNAYARIEDDGALDAYYAIC